MKKRITFIVNPFSGFLLKKDLASIIRDELLQEKYDYQILRTEAPKHAMELAQKALQDKSDIIVAVGGDGTVNEVASQLVDTDATLGIVPAGSGNGLATYLGIKRNLSAAIGVINTGYTRKIDTCYLNDRPFFNISGVGYDAAVAYEFKQDKVRGLVSYVRIAVNEAIKTKPHLLKMTLDDAKVIERECLLVSIANTPVFGYGLEIAPKATPDDGFLEVFIANKRPKLTYVLNAPRMINKSMYDAEFAERYAVKSISIHPSTRDIKAHIDGEAFLVENSLHYSIKHLSLSVIVPNLQN